MSYADMAAKGPKQSPEEARAPPVPTLQPEESESASLVDVDSPHISSVKSDFEDQAIKTETQAARMEKEAEADARAEAKKVEAAAENAKKKAASAAKKAEAEVKKEAKKLDDNKDNPVYVGNMVLWGITAAVVGYGAYKKHSEGKLDLEVVGTTAAILGVLGAADYFGSKWLVANKYPTK